MHRDRFYTLSASCPDQVGIVAKVSGFIAGNGAGFSNRASIRTC
jgi:formyltetrahydrofolate deformylase